MGKKQENPIKVTDEGLKNGKIRFKFEFANTSEGEEMRKWFKSFEKEMDIDKLFNMYIQKLAYGTMTHDEMAELCKRKKLI